MSLYDYKKSKEIAAADYPFYALIMAAIRQADSVNLMKLQSMFPEVYDEFIKRFSSPGGVLPSEDKE